MPSFRPDVASRALSAEFLWAALCAPVTSVAWERIGTDRGFAGSVLRVVVGAPGDEPRRTVVAKLGADGDDGLALAREIAFYRDVADAVAAPAPRCLWAGPAGDGVPLLVLEDLTDGRPGDQLAGAAADDVVAVLRAMTPVWRCRDFGAAAALPVRRGEASASADRYRLQWAALREELSGRLPREVWRVAERLAGSLGEVVAALGSAPLGVTHGDLHLDNVVFRVDGTAVVLDWAGASLSPVASDAFPFVATALAPADQERWAQAIVDEALEAIVGADETARRRFVDDGRRALLRHFAGVVGWLSRPPTGITREAALRAAAIDDGRLAHAMQMWKVERVLG